MRKLSKIGAAAVVAGSVVAASPALAADQITILIGYGFGGTYGKYARTMADHLRNYLPGKPNIIVQSMPGAGGLKATNYAAKVMPSNGLYILEPPDTLVISQLMRPKKIKYDARKFTWIGSVNRTNTIFVLRKEAGDTSTMYVDAWEFGAWTPDYAVFPIADDRPFRGLDTVMADSIESLSDGSPRESDHDRLFGQDDWRDDAIDELL